MKSSKPQNQKKMDLIDNQIKVLLNHFDTVQIFATKFRAEDQETDTFASGGGLWPARFGQIHEWMIRYTGNVFNENVKPKNGDNA